MRYPFAAWLPVKDPSRLQPFRGTPKGLVLHISNSRGNTLEGLLATFDGSVTSSGNKLPPSNPFPSHFGVQTNGRIGQFLDTSNRSLAEEGPSYFSIECAANPGDALTVAQIGAVARLYAWLTANFNLPLQKANMAGDMGIGYHSMFITKHNHCPGLAVIGQRDEILESLLLWLKAKGDWRKLL
jgi:hypothetical protein